MNKLHLVGFTTDLKSLVFARRKGSKTGSFLVPIDDRLRRTLEEVDKLEEFEDREPTEDGKAAQTSKLTPKDIQAHLREGKSAEEVAKLAETDVSWIQKFTGPIVAEKGGVIDAVRGAVISKPRLGPSALPAGEAVEVNLLEKRIIVPPEIIDDSWSAVKRGEEWQVTFRYVSRGQARVATFSYDPERRETQATNSVARDIAWRSPEAPTPDEVAAQSSGARGGRGGSKKRKSSRRGRKKTSKRSSAKKSPASKKRSKGSKKKKKSPGSRKKRPASRSRKGSSRPKKKPGPRKKSSGGRPRTRGGGGSRRSKG